MRAMVTGGAGFIGSHVVDALVARGDDVVVVDNLSTGKRANLNERARFAEPDIRDAAALGAAFAEARPESVFHLAAQADVRRSVENPALDADGERRRDDPRARSRARATALRSSSPRPAARSTASASGRRTEDVRAQPLAPTGRRARRRGVPRDGQLACTAPATWRFARQRLRATAGPARRGRRGRDLLRPTRRRREPRSSETARQTRDYVYVGDVRRGDAAGPGQDGGVFNVGTGARPPSSSSQTPASALAASARARVRGGAARRAPAKRPRSGARRTGAGLPRGKLPGRRPRGHMAAVSCRRSA